MGNCIGQMMFNLGRELKDALSRVVRSTVGRSRAVILVYHRISPEMFEAHVVRLIRLYNVIPHDQLVVAIERRDWSGIPPRALVIHFDDGHKGFADLEPVIRKYKLPITQFLVSGGVGTNRHCWFSEAPREFDGALKRASREERLAWLKDNVAYESDREYPEREMLSIEEIRRLQDAGVQFGAHTVTHEELPTCDDETAWREISESKRQLEETLGVPVEHFAYPSGNVSPRDVDYVRRAGFRSARIMRRGWNSPRSDLHMLMDLGPGDDLTPSQIGHLELISLGRRMTKAVDRMKQRVKRLLFPGRARIEHGLPPRGEDC